jgi:DNA-binding GntR family transcriptional regulator
MKSKGKKSNSVDAYQSIKNLILESKILPGASITEEALATELNIGRTPIREALMRLEQEGLIITENRRKRVFMLDEAEVNQIFELKICIESSMAGYAAERATKTELDQIRKTMEAMDAQAAQLPTETTGQNAKAWFEEWMDLDAQLHQQIYLAAHNPTAWEIISGFNTKIHRFKLGLLTLQGRVAISVTEHRRFVDAILKRSSDEAEQHMKTHLNNVHRELIKLMKIFAVGN